MHLLPKKQKFSADAWVETGIAHDGTVPRSVAFFISLFSGSNRFASNGSLFTDHSNYTLITRIRSNWGLSKAGVCSTFVLFRIPQRGSRWAPLSQKACSGEWRPIQNLRRGGKWETLGRYVLIHLQLLHSLFFLFSHEHIDVIMRIGLLAPFKLSRCRIPVWKCAQPMHIVLGPSLAS